MSLDTEKLHRLRGKSFVKLQSDNASKWKAMVEKARAYAQTCVGDEQVRIGNVVTAVQMAIRIDPTFEQHTQTKVLPQKYWVTWFAEYIVDCVYPQPVPMKAPAHHNTK